MLKETLLLFTIMKHLLPIISDFSAKKIVVVITTRNIKAEHVMKFYTN